MVRTRTYVPTVSRPLVIRCTNRMGIRVPAGITRSPDSSARSASAIAFTRRLESVQRSGTARRWSGRAQTRQRRSEEHTSELQSRSDLVCRLLLEKKKKRNLQLCGTVYEQEFI